MSWRTKDKKWDDLLPRDSPSASEGMQHATNFEIKNYMPNELDGSPKRKVELQNVVSRLYIPEVVLRGL